MFYYGVRNAYRFSFDPVTNVPVLGDVGWNNWEELNTGPAGSNFGWPYLEGPDRTASYQNLSQAITFYNNGNRNNLSDPAAVFPILPLSDGAPDNAHVITAGDFYNQNTMFLRRRLQWNDLRRDVGCEPAGRKRPVGGQRARHRGHPERARRLALRRRHI